MKDKEKRDRRWMVTVSIGGKGDPKREAFCFQPLQGETPDRCTWMQYQRYGKGAQFEPKLMIMPESNLIRFAARILVNPGCADERYGAPHLYIPYAGKLPASPSGPTARAYREAILSVQGRYGPALPEVERRRFLRKQPLTLGEVTLSPVGKNDLWMFSHNCFSYRMAAEFAAHILRDSIVKQPEHEKLAHLQVPWLAATRNFEDWVGTDLKEGLPRVVVAVDGLPPQAVVAENVQYEEEEDEGFDPPPSAEQISPVCLHADSERAIIRPNKEAPDLLAFSTWEGERTVEEDGQEQRRHYGNWRSVAFLPSWEVLAGLICKPLRFSPLSLFRMPGFGEPGYRCSDWVVQIEDQQRIPNEKVKLRTRLSAEYKSSTAPHSYAQDLVAGRLDAWELLPGIVLSYVEGQGFGFSTTTGEPAVFTLEQYMKLVCLILSDPETESLGPGLYSPFLLEVLRRWDPTLFSDAPLSAAAAPKPAPKAAAMPQPTPVAAVAQAAPAVKAVAVLNVDPLGEPAFDRTNDGDPIKRGPLKRGLERFEAEVLRIVRESGL